MEKFLLQSRGFSDLMRCTYYKTKNMSDFLNRYQNNSCSDSDFEEVVKLLLTDEQDDVLEEGMQQNWKETNNEGNIPALTGLLYKIHYRINKNEPVILSGRKFIRYFSRVAAILIFPIALALAYFVYQNSFADEFMQTISAPLASRTNFELPDGSKVWLNAGSSVTFPTHFLGKIRKVELVGQAYFDVIQTKSSFEVKAGNTMVKVLGTAFDVSAYSNENVSVTLVRGKVMVNSNKGNELDLVPGQQASVESNGKISKREVTTSNFVSWKDNILVFNHEPLEQVVTKLERWYNLDITIGDESIKNINVTGTFKYESISEILQLLEITEPIKYSYNKNERTLILKHK